jgi:hypothetical protein
MANKVDDKERIGIGGFSALATVRQQETTTASAPATPLEDGSLAHDHIVLNPLQLNIEGRVSDILIKPTAEVVAFRRGLAEIGNITKYLPTRTQTQINRIAGLVVDADNYVKRLNAVVADGRQAFEFFGSKDDATGYRAQFLEMLESYHNGKTLMRIETPTRVFENMVIVSRVITRDNTADDVIDFKITAQQLRFAEVVYTDSQQYFKSPATGDAADKTKGQTSKGLNDAPEVESSLATSLKNSVSGLFQ